MRIILVVLILIFVSHAFAQQDKPISVIAYYSGPVESIDAIPADKITHIIYCFGHLKGNQYSLDKHSDSLAIEKMVRLKKKNPLLKVIVSLGGWSGCETCSPVFSSAAGRHEFALSVLKISQYFKTDGIDLDWEYPTIEGYPGHAFMAEDRSNFTELIKDLRSTLGSSYEISFAAGGFQKFIDLAVDWKAVVPVVDRINVMTYDLVGGYSIVTGHHTPLYSVSGQKESTDNAIQSLVKAGVPRSKLVLGAAFYGRMWEDVAATNNGLFQSGKFKSYVDYKDLITGYINKNGFVKYWDNVAKAPYLYSKEKKLYITYDDKDSMKLKTRYTIDNGLDGIMFWELSCDKPQNGLLDEIVTNKNFR